MSEIYVSLEEAAGLEGVAYTAMLNRIDRSFGSIRVKRVNQAKGGRPFTLVCLDSLSSKAQRAYHKAHEMQAEAPDDELPWYLQVDLNWYIERNKVAYYRAVEAAKRIEKFAGYDLYGDKAEYAEELAQIMGISQRSLYRMTDAWLEAHAWAVHLTQQTGESYEHLTALALCRKPRMAGAFPSIPAEHKALIENIWFDRSFAQNNCSIELLYERYTALGKEKGWTSFPSTKTVGRYITYLMETRRAKSAHYLAARGEREWKNQKMLKAKRDTHSLLAMEYVQGDEHTFDCWVAARINGRLRAVRPKLVAWIDVRTRCIMGSVICVDANTQTIKQSLTKMIYSERGGVPHHLHIDNGKDYRSHRFEGETLVETDLGCLNAEFSEKEGLLRALGVGVHHALPYRGWSKDVERAFGTLEDFVREFPGWCGDSPEERPEDNGRILRRMKERGELMTFETFAKCFAEKLLPKYENHIGEDGLSPDQRYRQAEKARADTPDWATMAIFKSQSVKRVVTTQGVRLNNQLFWHPEMADIIREQVTIYYNRGYNPSVSVFSGGHFVCEAEPVELMALIDPDEERVAAHMADQKRQQRKVTDRLAYIRQSTKRITREAYAEEIDEQRQRMATVTSLEAARAGKAKQQGADKAAGRRKAASAGENAVRSMIAANGEKLLKRSAR